MSLYKLVFESPILVGSALSGLSSQHFYKYFNLLELELSWVGANFVGALADGSTNAAIIDLEAVFVYPGPIGNSYRPQPLLFVEITLMTTMVIAKQAVEGRKSRAANICDLLNQGVM